MWSLDDIRQEAEQAARDAEAEGDKAWEVHMDYGYCLRFIGAPQMVESQRRRLRHQINSLIRESGGAA